jgi:hypothetical protein
MRFSITISEEARNDELESYHYYELQRNELGDEFLDVLENCYASISKNPQFFSFTDKRKVLRHIRLK